MASFHGATLTKLMMGLVGFGIVASPSNPQWREGFELRSTAVLSGEVWRVLTSQAAPMGMLRGAVAMALFFRLARVERAVGTSRLCALGLVACLASGAAVLGASASTGFVLERAEPGPLALLGLMLGILGTAIPPSSRAEQVLVGGVPVTDKTVTMALGLWLAAGGGFEGLIPCAAGFAVGGLFASGALPFLSDLSMPAWVRATCSATVGRALASPAPGAMLARHRAAVRALRREQAAMLQQQRDAQGGGGGAARRRGVARPAAAAADGQEAVAGPQGADAAGPPPGAERGGGAAAPAGLPVVEPDPEMVRRLGEMGFERGPAEAALRRTLNNFEHAVAALIDA